MEAKIPKNKGAEAKKDTATPDYPYRGLILPLLSGVRSCVMYVNIEVA